MACGCGRGKNSYGARRRNAAATNPSARLKAAQTRNSGAAAQVRAQATPKDPNTKTSDEKRRIEKLRRQAILRSLGQL